MGMDESTLESFRKAIDAPHGMILVTGPTGSGKTTTLYSVLHELNSPQYNIVTVEDPIEYELVGVNQVAVRNDIGLDFASALRSILRQDPDIVMVGEIRDNETADIAVKAALTGHQVLSTLHTNDAAGAITRLDDMGIEPFLISSSMLMSCAQRLVRRVCTNCREEFIPEPEMFERLGMEPKKDTVFYHGHGCDRCKRRGYLGRAALIEALAGKRSDSPSHHQACLRRGDQEPGRQRRHENAAHGRTRKSAGRHNDSRRNLARDVRRQPLSR